MAPRRGPAGDGEERHEGDALIPAGIHEPVFQRGSADAVPVLHADHGRDGQGLGELPGGHTGDAEVPDQPGVAQSGQGAEMLRERAVPCWLRQFTTSR